MSNIPRLFSRIRLTKSVRYALIAFALYLMLAIAFTWPLVLNFSSAVSGPWKGDNLEYVWKLWWVPHALFQQHTSPFVAPDIYYPFGYSLSYGELTPIHSFFMMPLTLLMGEVVAYNLMILLSLTAGAMAAFGLCWRWLRNVQRYNVRFVASFFAGASFGFSAYQLVRIAGHLPLVDIHWLVLSVWMLDRWFETKRLRDATLLGVAMSCAALSSWYYALFLLLLLPVYAFVRAENKSALLTQRNTWAAIGIVAVIVAILCGPFLIPYLDLSRKGFTQVTLKEASYWSASPLDYLAPNARNPITQQIGESILWGDRPYDSAAEFVGITAGWLTLALGILGWVWSRGKQWRATKWLIVAALILSFGPFLHLGRADTGWMLPSYWLRMLPLANGMRVWARFSIFVVLGLSLLAGSSLAKLLQTYPPLQRWRLGWVASAVLIFSLWPGEIPLVQIQPRPVDQWLAAQPESFAIMQYPLSDALSGPSMLYTRYHGKRVTFGYGTYLPLIYASRHPDVASFPSDAAIKRLRQWGVKYILVAVNDLSSEHYTLHDVDRQAQLQRVITIGDQVVYTVLPDALTAISQQATAVPASSR